MRLRFDSLSLSISYPIIGSPDRRRTEQRNLSRFKLVCVYVKKGKKNGNGEKKNGSSERGKEGAREGNVIGVGIGSKNIGGGGRVDTK